MRRAILWVNDNLPALLAATVVWLMGALFVAMFRFKPEDFHWNGYVNSMGYVGLVWAPLFSLGCAWPSIVAWAKQPPKIAPRKIEDEFMEMAQREVDAIAREIDKL